MGREWMMSNFGVRGRRLEPTEPNQAVTSSWPPRPVAAIRALPA
jgi:hypothetical protein